MLMHLISRITTYIAAKQDIKRQQAIDVEARNALYRSKGDDAKQS